MRATPAMPRCGGHGHEAAFRPINRGDDIPFRNGWLSPGRGAPIAQCGQSPLPETGSGPYSSLGGIQGGHLNPRIFLGQRAPTDPPCIRDFHKTAGL